MMAVGEICLVFCEGPIFELAFPYFNCPCCKRRHDTNEGTKWTIERGHILLNKLTTRYIGLSVGDFFSLMRTL